MSGAKWLTEYAAKTKGEFLFEYTPESFTGTELDFAVEICNAVLDVWKPQKEHPVIINLASTVSLSMPHVYANQIEYMSDHLNYRENVILSLHPHNDRGSASRKRSWAFLQVASVWKEPYSAMESAPEMLT